MFNSQRNSRKLKNSKRKAESSFPNPVSTERKRRDFSLRSSTRQGSPQPVKKQRTARSRSRRRKEGQKLNQTKTTASSAAALDVISIDTPSPRQDIQITEEKSAWDALEERFEEAANLGRYLDLTEDDNAEYRGTNNQRPNHNLGARRPLALSAEDARNDFEHVPVPTDVRTIIQEAQPSTTEQSFESFDSNPELKPLWGLISDILVKLKNIRGKFSESYGNVQSRIRSMKRLIRKINNSVDNLQNFVANPAHSSRVADSQVAVDRIQEINQLVLKANILISKSNRQNLGE